MACQLLVAACLWDLAPRPGIKPGPPALGAQSLNHCTTREVPVLAGFETGGKGQGTTFKRMTESLIHQRADSRSKKNFCSLWKKNHTQRKIDKMKRQRTLYQMKEQDKTPQKQLNEAEIGNLPEKEFRIMIVKMIQDLGKRMEAKIEKMQEIFNKDLEE